MTQLSHEGYQATKWQPNSKPRGIWGCITQRPLDEENVLPNLDYKALQQIADGVEKMILSWSNKEREPYHPPCMRQVMESNILSSIASDKGIQKQEQTSSQTMKIPLSEKNLTKDGGCNYMCPVKIQENPGDVTTAISISDKCPTTGMDSSISQNVRAESIANKDMQAKKSLTKTDTYWYMESSNGNSQGCRANSNEANEKLETKGHVEGFHSTFNESCYKENGLGVRHWSKEATAVRSIQRSESNASRRLWLPLGNEIEESSTVAPLVPSMEIKQKSSNLRGSKHNQKKEIMLLKQYASGDQHINKSFTKPKYESDAKTQVLLTETKLKDVALEVPPLSKVNMVIDGELLEKKLADLTTMPPTLLLIPIELSEGEQNKQVQDLQIALLECAMEYELKTIELKMKIKSLQSTPKHVDHDSKSPSEKTIEMLYSKNSREAQIVESMKKQIFKLQREKSALTKEFFNLQKKERKFDTQQRSLDDALLRVNRLTKEVLKKEHELMEAQLMEKQIKVQLQETEEALAKVESNHMLPYRTGFEPAKLVAALPSLREWIKNLKKDHSYEPMIVKMVDGYYSLGEEPDHSNASKLRPTNELAVDNAQKVVEKMVHTLMREVQALQRDLNKLGGCRNLKSKSAPLSGEFLKSTNIKKEHSK